MNPPSLSLGAWYAQQVKRGHCSIGEAAEAITGHRIVSGDTPFGMRYAACGPRRVVAYAEGGCACFVWLDGAGWTIATDEDAPEYRPLVAVLGLPADILED